MADHPNGPTGALAKLNVSPPSQLKYIPGYGSLATAAMMKYCPSSMTVTSLHPMLEARIFEIIQLSECMHDLRK